MEAQLKETAQPVSDHCLLSIHQSRVSQPWHCWHLGCIILCCTFFVVLCIVGGLAAALSSVHYMPVVPFSFGQPKLFLDIAKYPPGGEIFHALSPAALEGSILSYVLKETWKETQNNKE